MSNPKKPLPDVDDDELKAAEAVVQRRASNTKQGKPALPYSVISARDFDAMPLPARVTIIVGVLFSKSLVEIHAWRGIGKTWIAMIMARCIALAEPFLQPQWAVLERRRVLFVDGEMAAIDMQERFKKLGPIPEMLDLMVSELLWGEEGQGLVLNNADHQARFVATLKELEAQGRRPEVIVFDNLSSLTAGIDENSNSEQDQLLAFFRQLRHEGYTVVFVHHDGKTGAQRGASRREDFLDLVIHLSQPKSGKKGHGDDAGDDDEPLPCEPKFVFEFTKARGKAPHPSGFRLELVTGPDGNLTTAISTGRAMRGPLIEQKEHILRYIYDSRSPVTRSDVKTKFDIGSSTAKEHVQKLIKAGWLEGGPGSLKVSARGEDRLFRLFPDLAGM
jgi:AAA domain